MNSIGFKNFRKFTEFPPIKLGGITLLVGGNNAGKSTLVKAMLLMRNFLIAEGVSDNTNIFKTFTSDFKFDTKHVNIGNFQRAFCKDAKEDQDTITMQASVEQFFFTVEIKGDRLRMNSLPIVSRLNIKDTKHNVEFNFSFSTNKMSVTFAKNDSSEQNLEKEILSVKTLLENLHKELNESTDIKASAELNNKIQEAESRQKKLMSTPSGNGDYIEIPMSIFINEANTKIIPSMIKGFMSYASLVATGKKNTKTYQEAESAKMRIKAYAPEISEIANEMDGILNQDAIQYIYAHSVNQQALYNIRETSDYATKTIHEFFLARITKGDEEFDFILKWIKKFGIGIDINVYPILGEAYQVSVKQESGAEVDLADLGMGSIQLTILLLRIATLMRRYKGSRLTILLEEPEQNLHPALQSDLADLLFEVNQSPYGFKFVVETHSEYLVRKSQVIVAQKFNTDQLLKDNPFVTYYMPAHGLPYSMEYKTTGRFEERFGSGFFDEASNSNMALIRLERGLK